MTDQDESRNPKILIPIAIVIVLVGMIIFTSIKHRDPTPVLDVNSVPERLPGDNRRPTQSIPPSKIADISGGWTTISDSGMSGSYSRFNVIDNFAFAQEIASQWNPDTQIGSIFVDGVNENGKIDLSARKNGSVEYRFYSPKHRKTAKEANENTAQRINSELRLLFEAETLTATMDELQKVQLQRYEPHPRFVPSCSLGQLMEAAKENNNFKDRESYKLLLQYIESFTNRSKSTNNLEVTPGMWIWTLSCDDCKNIRIKATTCSLDR